MKIASPWPYHALTRAACKTPNGEISVLQSARMDLELPDDTEEALLEPVKYAGRGGAVTAMSQGRIWSREWGLLDIEDHLKKMELKEEETKLNERIAADAKRRKAEKKAEATKERARKVIDAKVDAKLGMEEKAEQ